MILFPERLRAYAEELAALLEQGRHEEAARVATNLSAARVAHILSTVRKEAVMPFLRAVGPDRAAAVVADMPVELAAAVLAGVPEELAVRWLVAMPPDFAKSIVVETPEAVAERLLALMPEDARTTVRRLADYPEGSAGAVMSPYFAALPTGKRIADAIEAVLSAPPRLTRTGYTYVVSDGGRLEGVVSLRDLMLADSSRPIESVMRRDVLAARVTDPALEAAHRLRTRRLKMLPIVESDDTLVGVVTIEDAFDLLSHELAADLTGIGAVSAEEGFFTPPRRAIAMRLPWMAANIFLNLGAVSIIASFEETIAAVAILAAFLPMITDMGGNVGIQALSVSIRSIALGEVRIRDYWLAARKEVAIGLVNGLALGALFGLVAYLLEGNFVIAIVAATALAMNVLVAGVVGGTIPFLIKRLGRDPAMMTGPVLTTITDITGVSIYLGLSTLFLAGMIAAGM